VLRTYRFNGKLGDSQFTLIVQANLAVGDTAKVSLYYEDYGRANSQSTGLDTFGKFRKLIRRLATAVSSSNRSKHRPSYEPW
jgi:hypothetical protein